jgi:hypothetical protein
LVLKLYDKVDPNKVQYNEHTVVSFIILLWKLVREEVVKFTFIFFMSSTYFHLFMSILVFVSILEGQIHRGLY